MAFLDALSGQTRLGESDFNYDPEGLARKQFEKTSDPRFTLPYFQKLLANSAPTRAALLQTAKATGGSQAIANAVAESMANRSNEQAVSGYEKSLIDMQGIAQGYLGQDLERQQFIKSGLAQQEYANAANASGFVNNLIGAGATGLTNYLMGSFNQQPQQQQPQIDYNAVLNYQNPYYGKINGYQGSYNGNPNYRQG